MSVKNHITVFEHDTLRVGENSKLSQTQLEALQRFYGTNGVPYYSLVHKGVRFCEYVGVLQVGNLTIEVLPKIDKITVKENEWQTLLIDMLRFSGILEVETPSSAILKVKSNFILDVYIELLVQECEQLLRRGLVKKYRQTSGNIKSLKGSLQFASHIKENIVHQERFYCRFTTYDIENVFNQILYQALLLIEHINTSPLLTGRISYLLLSFPEMENIKVTEATFSKLILNRKTAHYSKGIEIARLLLLNYHPDVVKGRENVLALMFDMNKLWELFILKALRRQSEKSIKILAQRKAKFWESNMEVGYKILKPDIVVEGLMIEGKEETIILDTKWKLPPDNKPSDSDLKQMFAYNENFDAKASYLIYPSNETKQVTGTYNKKNTTCHLIFLDILGPGKKLNKEVGLGLMKELGN